jgi:DNA-binding transcriptional MerR regulator
MESIYLNVVLTLVIGVLLGSNATSLKFEFIKGITKFSVPFLRPKDKVVIQSQPVERKVGNRYFDDLEIRLLKAIIQQDNEGLGIAHLNSLMNLTKLSEENQRQRRHLFLKELNLKLYLIYGIREGITRIESVSDKRIKMYVLNDKIDSSAIEELMKG